MRDVLAIILGGGRGTRLFPLTQLRAKPAVPIAGKYRLIDIPVSNCINSNVHKIYVLTQFNSASLNRHISQSYPASPFSDGFVEILAAQQTPEHSNWFQGTADAVRQYLPSFLEHNVNDYLILSGDHLYRMNYQDFIAEHRQNNADITVSVIPVTMEKASEFGLLKIDNKGCVVEFCEKPQGAELQKMQVDTVQLGLEPMAANKMPFIASMGIYVFKRQVLQDLLAAHPDTQDFGREILPIALDSFKVRAYLFKGYWEDIGTIQSFYEANLGLTDFVHPAFSFYDTHAPIITHQRFLPPSKILQADVQQAMICEGCIIREAVIRRSIIGVRSIIRSHSQIENSLVMGADYYQSREAKEADKQKGLPSVGIGHDTVIRKAIIDKNARIGSGVRIFNEAEIEEADYPERGIWIRNGIVIVTKNAVIPDGTQV
ncbi:MAG TPA: glucose-1-phosphate adenylyltransferase [bacterium]|nr:glucose-1-phosphate adenylyltransferase [bacterium]HPG44529.1 glucose-1-phosphate adenylyltransferase [bacterium]HPM97087.1 glucose-1-phosphate adenylyltransferase [bacterium]